MAYLVFLKNFQKFQTMQLSNHNYTEQEQRMEGGDEKEKKSQSKLRAMAILHMFGGHLELSQILLKCKKFAQNSNLQATYI